MICLGDRPSDIRHAIVFTLAERLIAEQKKVMIISNDFDFSRALIKYADIKTIKQYEENLIIINNYPLFKMRNRIKCWLEEWKRCQYIFIEVNLKFPPKGLRNAKYCLKRIKQNIENKNIILFTCFLRKYKICDSSSDFSEHDISDFPKHIEKYADKLLGISMDISGQLCKILNMEKDIKRLFSH